MESNSLQDKNVSAQEMGKIIVDFFHRNMVHHVLWYSEVKHQMGEKRALELFERVSKKSMEIQLGHLGRFFGFELKDGVPESLVTMESGKQQELLLRVAKNWLVTDGVWFQEIEKQEGMNEAKRCNDSCWAQFSPFEASSIKSLLQLEQRPGLEGLKQALAYRLYAVINKQSITDETEDSFVFQMNDCRVQSARKRKGLADYPCKSAGMVEYSYFARGVDDRISTECIGCPPDEHPDHWYCAWKFSLSG